MIEREQNEETRRAHAWLEQFLGEWETEGDADPEDGPWRETGRSLGGPWIIDQIKGLALGLLIGFAGVVVLLSKDLTANAQNSIIGQAAVILASIFYAGSAVFAKEPRTRVR